MDLRKFIFDWFRETTPVNEFQEVMFEDSSIEQLPATKPFATYRFGTLRPTLGGSDMEVGLVQAVYVQIHDLPGDYDRIDQWLVPWTMNLGADGYLPADLLSEHPYILSVSLDYLSEDFRNPDWGTIFRALRLYVNLRNPNS